MYREFRHQRYEEISAMLRQGATDTDAASAHRADRRTVAQIRSSIGLPPVSGATTVEEKLDRFSVPLEDGHTGWSGRRSSSGKNPLLRHRGREMSASAASFQRHYGRPPIGMVKADCGMRHCLTGGHLLDDPGRLALRLQLRALHGMPAPWDVCPHGLHSWDEHGRVEPDLTLYCAACGDERKRRSDLRKRQKPSQRKKDTP